MAMSQDIQVLHGKALRSFPETTVKGEALVTAEPITLLGFVDPKTGNITEPTHELNGVNITDKIFVFPRGVGSTVGPYTLLNLVQHNKAPAAIINRESDQGTIAGCSVARIPLAYGFDRDPIITLQTGDEIELVITNGTAEIRKL